jgi:hypothetical protein
MQAGAFDWSRARERNFLGLLIESRAVRWCWCDERDVSREIADITIIREREWWCAAHSYSYMRAEKEKLFLLMKIEKRRKIPWQEETS